MATLAISRDMLADYAKLPKAAQTKVAQLADTFRQLTAQQLRASGGIHLEPYTNQKDPRARTIRIGDNHRGIVYDAGNDELFVLTRVGTHDDVDHWMMHNSFKVNEATGALEILNTVEIEEAAARAASTAAEAAPAPAPALFEHRADKDFTKLGIEADLIPTLRVLTSDDQLQGLIGVLPQGQAETLILLTGDDTVETIYAQVAGSITPDEVDTTDVAAALTTPATRAQFEIISSEGELQEMLARPLAHWRTFLHPSQRDAVERSYSGPARITGGAGTGKTVVAIHRAVHLARTTEHTSGKPILFTTFTRNLADAIEHDVRDLGGTTLSARIEVLNVDRLAFRVVQDAEGIKPGIASGPELMDMWRDVVDERGIDHPPEFLHHEWEQVILAQGCSAREEYFTASRAGRGVRLDRRQRAEVWKAVEALNRSLIDRGKRTHLQLAAAAAGYLSQRTVKPYQHIVVDEAQDLHETQWRLLRAAVAEQPDDLFIVGDSHQRIYDRRSSLGKVGIKIVGRSRKLRINYRTTHEILGWSLSLLGEGSFDDLDDGTDTHDFAGYHSYLHGPRPTLRGTASTKAQLDELIAQITAWREGGVNDDEIGVTARANRSLDDAERALTAAGIPTCRLGTDMPTGHGIRLGTMHRFKGLEFRCVAVIDVDDDTIPAPWDLTPVAADEVQRAHDLQRERCLLYVACTRARDDLYLSWSGTPSRFLEGALER